MLADEAKNRNRCRPSCNKTRPSRRESTESQLKGTSLRCCSWTIWNCGCNDYDYDRSDDGDESKPENPTQFLNLSDTAGYGDDEVRDEGEGYGRGAMIGDCVESARTPRPMQRLVIC